jgi:hypothetical protein
MTMGIMKLAVLTCAFYLTASLILEALVILAARVLGSVMALGTPWVWGIVFGPIWAISFALACLVFRSFWPTGG